MIRTHLTFANVVSVIALFIALGGGAYAAGLIGSSDIAKNAIHSRHIAKKAVEKRDVKLPAKVTSAHLPATRCQAGVNDAWHDASALGYAGPVGYFRDISGVVHLQGTVIYCGQPPFNGIEKLFTLPPGYRPGSGGTYVPGMHTSGGGIDPVLIDTLGNVTDDNFDTRYALSLEGISFRCRPAGTGGCP